MSDPRILTVDVELNVNGLVTVEVVPTIVVKVVVEVKWDVKVTVA